MEEDNKKYEKGTLGWLREQQKIKAEKDGFDNVDEWLKWKSDPFNILEKKYGNEFSDWARKNKGKRGIEDSWINLGCKTEQEYRNKLAQRAGFKDFNNQRREWRHERGENLPLEFNEDCSSWFGEFTENLMIRRYPGAIKMPYGNPGFDYQWDDTKINNKGRCLQYVWDGSPRFQFEIRHNHIAKKFILSGWDNRESLTPLIALEFDRDDNVRYGKGRYAPKIEFWKRYNFTLTYSPEGLEQFEDYRINIDWLKDLCKESKENWQM